jgi:hypothetical protein
MEISIRQLVHRQAHGRAPAAFALALSLTFAMAPASYGAAATVCGDRIESPDAHWKTIHTKHYRIHYPANPKGGFLPFATEVASKIEGISAKVAEMVGFEAKGPIDVVVMDPLMMANGATVPILWKPFVILYKTPPEPDSQLDNFESWVDLLVTHELVHLHHLMRPQNGGGIFSGLLVGPLSRKIPRMVTEGYATMLEGRITGSGRPHSAYRSAVIRQWALQGKLPGYDEASEGGGYLGGAMAYLVGSAYLEWLEQQFPEEPEILVTFWKYLASKKRRDYEKSFEATFGIPPKDSYERWRAEVTHDAIAMEQGAKRNGPAREGELFAKFDGEVRDLAVSPDGTKLLANVLSKKNRGVMVWDLTGEWEKEHGGKAKREKEKEKEKKKKKESAPDPLEPEDRKPEFEDPEPMATIGRRNGSLARHAWWTGDGLVLLERYHPNAEGVLRPSFRTFDVKTKKERPAPRGTAAPKIRGGDFAKKDIGGIWNIVRKLPNGGEEQVTSTLSAAWQPAPSSDGKFLYYVRLTAMGCEIRKLDLTPAAPGQGQDQEPVQGQPVPSTVTGADGDGQRTAGAATQELQAAGAAPQAPQAAGAAPQAPQAAGAAPQAPQERADGQIPLPRTMLTKGAIISLPNVDSLLPPASAGPLEAKDYSVWESHKFGPLLGLSLDPSGKSYNLGIGGSDILNRLIWYAAASLGPAVGPRGAAFGASYSGWRISPTLDVFSSLEKPSAQMYVPVSGFDRQRRGAEISLGWERQGLTRAWVSPFAAFENIETTETIDAIETRSADRYMAGAKAGFSAYRGRGDMVAYISAGFRGAFGRTEYQAPNNGAWDDQGTDWRLFKLGAMLALGTSKLELSLSAEEGRLDGDFGPFDLFHLGGLAPAFVPSDLEMNRMQQPALPAYTQTGDRMRRLRADLRFDSPFCVYYERSAVWSSQGDAADWQRIVGCEIPMGDTLRLGVHRPLDGAMRGRNVYTIRLVVPVWLLLSPLG